MDENFIKCGFTSNSDDWATPQNLFNYLNDKFHFTLDPCADKYNHKCEKYYTEMDSGLSHSWKDETVFMNPPYGKNIKYWVAKAYTESKNNAITVIGLLPARTDTKWFHDYCIKSSEIIFIKGRLKFGDGLNSAPFPSIIIIWDGKNFQPKMSFMDAIN